MEGVLSFNMSTRSADLCIRYKKHILDVHESNVIEISWSLIPTLALPPCQDWPYGLAGGLQRSGRVGISWEVGPVPQKVRNIRVSGYR